MNQLNDPSTDPRATADQAGAARASAGLPRVAVVGRPNVGKSTLVNRILGRRAAITEAVPGVTRDMVPYEAEWSGRRFELVDTGGWEPRASGLAAQVVAQAERAMRAAELVLFVVDATVGVTEEDAAVSARLRRGGIPVLLVANKVDGPEQELAIGALWSLGLGEPQPVSSLHGRGAGELLDAVVARLGAELAIVAETPGTTRDTVDSVVVHDGRGYRVVDTAGMRRSLARAAGADYFALVRSMEAVDRADLALLVLEGPVGVAEQDQKVAARAVEAGCGLVLLANKWDLMDEDARRAFKADLEHRLWFVEWAPLLRVSARTGRGVDRIWRQVDTALAERARRVPTAALNQWLAAATGRTPPPPSRGRAVKVRYVTQARVDPPEFVFFASGPLTPAYRRFLEHDLRRTFGFQGTPLRVVGRSRNPRRDKG